MLLNKFYVLEKEFNEKLDAAPGEQHPCLRSTKEGQRCIVAKENNEQASASKVLRSGI